MQNLLGPDVFSQIVISVVGGFIVILLNYALKKLYRGALARKLSEAHKWTRTKVRRNRARKLWQLKNQRRDPAEVIRLTIRANTYFALFVICIAFYAGLILFLTYAESIPTTFLGKISLGTPLFFFEILWLNNHMSAEDLAKQRRKLFYKPKARKGEKDKAS